MHKITDVIDSDTAQLVAEEFGHMRASRLGGRRRGRLHRRRGSRRGFAAARADRHHHGPCRPRQDLAARRHPHDQCRGAGGRRHHPAYRRLSGCDAARPQDHVHRHAWPRGLHRHAAARRSGDRHRRAGGGGRRRREAADGRGHQSRQGRRRADDRRHQQDRQAGRRSAARPHRAAQPRDRGREPGRRYAGDRGLGAEADRPRQAARGDRACRPKCSS